MENSNLEKLLRKIGAIYTTKFVDFIGVVDYNLFPKTVILYFVEPKIFQVTIKPYNKSHKEAFDLLNNKILQIFNHKYKKRHFLSNFSLVNVFDITGVLNIDENDKGRLWYLNENEETIIDVNPNIMLNGNKIRGIEWEGYSKKEIIIKYKVINGSYEKTYVNYNILNETYYFDDDNPNYNNIKMEKYITKKIGKNVHFHKSDMQNILDEFHGLQSNILSPIL